MHFKFITFFSLNLAYASSLNDLGEVIFVNILFRHGDRTPVDPYPNDPYRNTSYWPAGWGELTNLGKKGHYELGKWLRNRYSTLLPSSYHKEDIYVQSTDVDRTLMSAYSNLAGLYEPALNNNWSPDIKWQPIPVHTTPEQSDMVRSSTSKSCVSINTSSLILVMAFVYMCNSVQQFYMGSRMVYMCMNFNSKVLAAKKSCPKYESDLKELKNSDDFRKINSKYKDLYQYLTTHSGMNITGVNNVETLYNTLFIESLYNLTLPAWTKDVYPQPLKSLAEFSFSEFCYTPQLARLKVGPLLSNMMKHMKKKIDGDLSPDRKAWIYSAHDTTVANVLKALGVFEPHCPPYLSLILLELRKKENDHYVTLFYRNSSTVSPYFLRIPGCDDLCPFKKFSELIAPVIPIDWEKECHQNLLTEGFYDSMAGSSFVLSSLVVALFLLIILLLLHVYKRQYHSQKDFVYHSLKMELQS